MTVSIAPILANVAEATPQGLLVQGGGWTVRDVDDQGAIAVGGVLTATRDEIGQQHQLRLEWLYASGEPVRLVDGTTVRVETVFVPEGLENADLHTPLTTPVAFNFGVLPLEPGREYVFRFSLDGETKPEWEVGFRTTPPQPQIRALQPQQPSAQA